ncbi:MAG: hypothetical protein ABJL99_10070 [Aliishimia sp.]
MTRQDDRHREQEERRRAVDAAIEECRAKPIEDVIDALCLTMEEKSGWFSGPCPECGGENRFNIKSEDGGFFCRKGCAAKGAGPIDLVMVVKRLEFLPAVQWLFGDLPTEVDEAELERRRQLREQTDRDRAAKKQKYREQARRAAISIWQRGARMDREPVREYLSRRGITREQLPSLPICLRFIADHPYVVSRKVDGKLQAVTMHRGDAMIAAIQAPDNRLICTHQTWFDLSKPNLKPDIIWNDKPERNKLTRGSQTRAAIRLVTPRHFDTLVMAEGIETTLTAAIAWPEILGPNTAYWSGISLQHLAGKMVKVDGKRCSGVPRMDDPDGFVPPPYVKRLIFIQDADSEPVSTKALLSSGLQRAMAFVPGLECQIVPAPSGSDLNDVLVSQTSNDDGGAHV